MKTTTLETATEAATRGDYLAIVRLVSGSESYAALWSAAMTAHFGTDLHRGWTKADGTPSEDALTQLPGLGHAMQQARSDVAELLAMHARRAA